MAFPVGLKVAGQGLTAVAEGLQAVPAYIDKDEELQEKHEDRLARRELRPLTLEEARLRLEKTREELARPKPISAGAHGSYLWNPETRKYEYDARSAALGATDTAAVRTIRSLMDMARSPDPQVAKIGQGILETRAGIKTTAQWQSMNRYFEALARGEQPNAADYETMQQVQNHYIKGSAEGGYFDLKPTMPGAPGQAPQAPPQAPGMPAPGSTGVDARLVRAILGNEGSGDTSISPKGAASKWQLMPETARPHLPPYMQQLSKEQIQEALVKYPGLASDIGMKHLGDLQRKYPGRPDLVAAAYFSGEGNVDAVTGTIKNPQLRAVGNDGQPFGPTVQEYVDRFKQRYGGQAPTRLPAPVSAQPPATATSPGGMPGTVPVGPQPPTASSTPGQVQPGAGAPEPTYLTPPSPKRLAETTASQRRAQGLPAYTHDEVAMAKRLASRKVIPSSDLASMNDADFTKVQDYLDAKKQEPLFQRRVKESEPQIAALDAIEMAEKVSEDIYPLLNWNTVGIGGFLNNAWQTATSAIGAYKDPNDRKTLQQAVDGTRQVIDLAKKRGDISQVLRENPKAAQDMMNPGAPTVRVLAAVLAYLHASAIKKGASAGSRGIAVQDIRLANELFDPVAWTSSPSAIREKLIALQTSYLRPDKEVIGKALALKGIDPMTRRPVKGFHFGPGPASDVQPKTGVELLDESDEAN